MTRPKSLRLAEKRAQQRPFAAYPVIAQATASLSPKHTVEIKLHDASGVHVAACLWDPGLPTEIEMSELQERLDEELAPLFSLAQGRSGQPTGDFLRITNLRNPFSGFPVLKEARVAVSEKYTLELMLHEVPSGDKALWSNWEPHPPTEAEEKAFVGRIDAALEPFLDLVFSQPGRSSWGGAA